MKYPIKRLLVFLALFATARASSFDSLQEKYDSLDDKGKFAVGGVIGFFGSRMLVKSAVGAIKIAGGAFIM